MLHTAGIIAEYNPFHNGHAYQLKRAREMTSAQRVIVAMSGSFTQRGDVAVFDKFLRAKWALENGADLVIELPTVFSLAPAERFARGGVGLLDKTGIVSELCFGAECGDVSPLLDAANLLANETDAFRSALSRALDEGMSFPAARSAAFTEAYGDASLAALISKPNNILAVEYLKAISSLDANLTPSVVERIGAAHDGRDGAGGFLSAAALRDALVNCDLTILRPNVPAGVYAEASHLTVDILAPNMVSALSDAIIYALRRLSKAELAALPDVAEGLENVIHASVREHCSYQGFILGVKSRRYTEARIRRIALSALLGIDRALWLSNPAPRYIRVLGVRADSVELLSGLSKSAKLPVVISYGDYQKLDAEAKRAFDIDLFASELLYMASPAPRGVENEFSRPLLTV